MLKEYFRLNNRFDLSSFFSTRFIRNRIFTQLEVTILILVTFILW